MQDGARTTRFIPVGTLLNTATVVVGGLIGWLIGKNISVDYRDIALHGLGLVTVGIGIKMLLQSKNILVVAAAIAFGGIIGLRLGIQDGISNFAFYMRGVLGQSDTGGFVDIVVSTSVLYCVGPMTLLGCIEDRLEGKIDLLALKSTMDGVSAIFFAISSGPALMVTAGVVLVFQSILTFSAKPLKPITDDPDLLAELTGAGGIMLMGTGLGLLEIKSLPVANYLPALALAPFFVWLGRKLPRLKKT